MLPRRKLKTFVGIHGGARGLVPEAMAAKAMSPLARFG
jgi:hypothetical protein